ncbi:hypothetical protein TI04_13865, partial [Achromatium sp. WMS2]
LTTYHFHPGDLKAAKIDKPNFGRGLPISAQRRSFLKPRWNHDRQERTNLLKTQCSGSRCLSAFFSNGVGDSLVSLPPTSTHQYKARAIIKTNLTTRSG